MIISELKVYNFRRFQSVDGAPGLQITFHKGLNALIGENDSGKTAVIDALKLVLLTQSNEYIKPVDEDFYRSADGNACSEFKIDCTLSDFTQNEAKNFIEYLNFKKDGDKVEYTLQLHYRAWKDGHRIYQELRVGDIDDGISIDGKARELLKAVYLKPLRDAEREMSSGRGSRISQILLNHPVFKDKKEHTVLDIFQDANKKIEDYFTDDADGKHILQAIRDNLASFNDQGQASNAELKTSDIQLKAILESLSLNAPEINPGLGELNLLFIAAELLLLKDDTDGGLKLALIEELEAHLHPQAQLRLINYLQNEYNENDVQIIISTHSPILASKINLKNLILMKNGCGYDLAEGKTGLQKGDYLFLQRFLDSTKANLFFAKGIIMVEGDAENILVPVLADIIGYPLEKYGISIVNVGSTAFLRYSGIMVRNDGNDIGIPVSVITDCDVKPSYDIDPLTESELFNEKATESEQMMGEKNSKYTKGAVRGFTSPRWTLEYCIALSCLSKDFHKAVHYGMKILNAREYISLTDAKINEANQDVETEAQLWESLSDAERAYRIYDLMLNGDGKSSLKAIVAQCLASALRWRTSKIPEGVTQEKMFDLDLYGFKTDEAKKDELNTQIGEDQYLRYIVNAIKYAAGEEI
ncbi:AAA family ATPase [Ruminococcus sp.]|uniref:ATP-dependent nuclease n=1 Tax=Ruminococcus sp. TaxID=41978 RepID=UPI0025D687C9|nr:AAA family ATPase [Ruminococcus sp.]